MLAFRTGLFEVFDRPAASSVTLVTFGNAATLADRRGFWAEPVADALDLDCIGIMPRFAHWYPAAEMALLAASLAPRLAGRQVVLYGDSMGAYAAIRHAALFTPAAILAVAPQASINPQDVPWDERFRTHFRPALHADMAIKAHHATPCAPFIIHDPHDAADHAHSTLIAGVMPTQPVHITHIGHQAVHAMADRDVFASVLDRALHADAPGMARLLRHHKKTNRFYLGRLGALSLTQGHLAWSDTILARAHQAGTGLADILWLRAHAHRHAQNWASAEADARASLALPDPNPARRADLWQLLYVHLRARGRLEAAASLAQTALAEFPQGSPERALLESVLQAP